MQPHPWPTPALAVQVGGVCDVAQPASGRAAWPVALGPSLLPGTGPNIEVVLRWPAVGCSLTCSCAVVSPLAERMCAPNDQNRTTAGGLGRWASARPAMQAHVLPAPIAALRSASPRAARRAASAQPRTPWRGQPPPWEGRRGALRFIPPWRGPLPPWEGSRGG